MKAVISVYLCLLVISVPSLFASTASLPDDHGGQIESRYDGFTYETVITLKKMRVNCGKVKGLESPIREACVSIVVSLHCPGKQLDYVRQARLQIIFETKDWDRRHPLDQRQLVAVADGQTLKLGRMNLVKQDLDTNHLHEVMKEILELSMPYETFDKLARASWVELKVGNSLFELKEKNLLALRDLNNRVRLQSSRTAN